MKLKQFLAALGMVSLFMSLYGCGSNVYNGLDTKRTDAASLDSALNNGDWAYVLGALSYLDNNQTSEPDNQVRYAKAELATGNFDAPTILANAVTSLDTSKTDAQNFAALKSLLPNVDAAKLNDATTRLNNAAPTDSGTQLTTGIANALNAVTTIYSKFDTNNDGSLTTADTALSVASTASSTWSGIKTAVTTNANNAATYTTAAFSNSSGDSTATKVNEGASDTKTQINKVNSAASDTAILDALLCLDGGTTSTGAACP